MNNYNIEFINLDDEDEFYVYKRNIDLRSCNFNKIKYNWLKTSCYRYNLVYIKYKNKYRVIIHNKNAHLSKRYDNFNELIMDYPEIIIS